MRGGRSNRHFIDLIDPLVEQDMSAHYLPCHLMDRNGTARPSTEPTDGQIVSD
jgi:hypothetical protein